MKYLKQDFEFHGYHVCILILSSIISYLFLHLFAHLFAHTDGKINSDWVKKYLIDLRLSKIRTSTIRTSERGGVRGSEKGGGMVKLKGSSIQSASVCVDKRGSERGSEGGSERGVNKNIEEDKDKGEKRTESSHTTNIYIFFIIIFYFH